MAAALTDDADSLRSFKEIATLQQVELERPADRATDLAGGAAGGARVRASTAWPSASRAPSRSATCSRRVFRRSVSGCSGCDRGGVGAWPAAAARGPAPARVSDDAPSSLRPPAAIALDDGLAIGADPGNVGAARRVGRRAATRRRASRSRCPTTSTRTSRRPATAGPSSGTRCGSTALRLWRAAPGTCASSEVRRTAEVWLNGRRIGASGEPYAPFSVPASSLRTAPPTCWSCGSPTLAGPGAFPQDWWNWGGIVGGVSLQPVGRLALDGPGRDAAARLRLPVRLAPGPGFVAQRFGGAAAGGDRRAGSSPRWSRGRRRARAALGGAQALWSRSASACGCKVARSCGRRLTRRCTGWRSRRSQGIASSRSNSLQVGMRSIKVEPRGPVPERAAAVAARRVDPRGRGGPRRLAERRRHRHDRLAAAIGRREHHARALPAQRPAARRARRRGDHGVVAAPVDHADSAVGHAARSAARLGHADGHDPRRAQPSVGRRRLGRQRADADPEHDAGHARST